jgi:8-oxo-dGTP pyrophosphatase MutT (NUDIX family)
MSMPTITHARIADRASHAMAEKLAARLACLRRDNSIRRLDWNMTPELAYGRHRGPSKRNSRQAAVAVALFYDPDHGFLLPLTRRPNTLRHHGGQICFPGGRIELGETPVQAALREFEEELGLSPDLLKICGQLPKQYVYASDNEVTPVVCMLRKPESDWIPDPGEVDEVIHLPLAAILEDADVMTIWQQRAVRSAIQPQRELAQVRFQVPAFTFRDQRIWGATAVILDQLAQCLR